MKRILLLVAALCITLGCEAKKTFTLWQLASQRNDIGNSYVIRTHSGKLIVMDGGYEAERDYLCGFLSALGGEVEAWMVSHPHNDHMGTLKDLLEKPSGIKINKIYHSRFTEALIDTEEKVWADYTRTFYSLLDNLTQTEVIDCHCGDEFEIDGIKFKILGEKNPEILGNGYNNSSMVIKMWDKHKSFIFLGDLGVEGGDKLLASEYAKDLECDYLQLAHHGNWAVKKNFYEKVKFRAALWPSPTWLYNNDAGKGFNTAHFESVIVRGWMEELGIKEHYVSCEGLSKIE